MDASQSEELLMPAVGQPERATQDRVVAPFRNEQRYRYLSDWTDRGGNSKVEEGLPTGRIRLAVDRRRAVE